VGKEIHIDVILWTVK